MTLSPFAALESRLNVTVQARLANATAVYQDGEPFGVLFNARAGDGFDGAVAMETFEASFCLANASGIQRGSVLVINGASYRVESDVIPDAGGWVVLDLYFVS